MVSYYHVLVLLWLSSLIIVFLCLNIGLTGNKTKCLLDSSATHNFISS